MFDVITENNFFLYAAKHYDNSSCTGLDDFYEDLNHIKYIKRLFNRHKTKGELKDRLITNHLILLYNVFGVEPATKILFFKLEEEYWSILKTFLVGLSVLPDVITGINNKDINTVEIEIDQDIVKKLRQTWELRDL